MQEENRPFRIALAGSVQTSRQILQALLRNGAHVVGVWGLSARKSAGVSGCARMDDLSAAHGIPYCEFEKINHPETVSGISQSKPDLLFVVGLSQMVGRELLAVPKCGCIGFHPTALPKGRGRAPLAWLTMEGGTGAVSFFLMDEGADSGPICVQEPFTVGEDDYASDVTDKICAAIDVALDRWIPDLNRGVLSHQAQDHGAATYRGKRAPEDGLIDWRCSAKGIYALVRAASEPHPGAYTYVNGRKLVVWRAKPERGLKCLGVTGRVLLCDGRGALVQTGEGLLWLESLEWEDDGVMSAAQLKVGWKLGFCVEDELFRLHRELNALKALVGQRDGG